MIGVVEERKLCDLLTQDSQVKIFSQIHMLNIRPQASLLFFLAVTRLSIIALLLTILLKREDCVTFSREKYVS